MERSSCSNPVLASVLIAAALLLCACAAPARYVLVTGPGDVDYSSGSRRYLCLSAEEAARVPGMVGLHSGREIARYERTRRPGGDPLEEVLYRMVKDEYGTAVELLERHGLSLPPGLRLLIRADLAYETDERIPAERLRDLYQTAFEEQTCGLNHDLILLRIRQMRYGR